MLWWPEAVAALWIALQEASSPGQLRDGWRRHVALGPKCRHDENLLEQQDDLKGELRLAAAELPPFSPAAASRPAHGCRLTWQSAGVGGITCGCHPRAAAAVAGPSDVEVMESGASPPGEREKGQCEEFLASSRPRPLGEFGFWESCIGRGQSFVVFTAAAAGRGQFARLP